jgi:hypothetical protein
VSRQARPQVLQVVFDASESTKGAGAKPAPLFKGTGYLKRGAPERRTIAIHCAACRTLLYRYAKGGTGSLVKCFVERIVEDRTVGDLKCPTCGQQFARPFAISGRPAHKIISGKVFTRGMRRK